MDIKLGDKVQFTRHYKKNHNYINMQEPEKWTPDQQAMMEQDGKILLTLVDIIEHPPIEGYISGKRNMRVGKDFYYDEVEGYTRTYEIAFLMTVRTNNIDQQVYLVACNMAGFYRVHPDWIEKVEG